MSNSFIAKKDCCGCAACINICPKHAISLTTDENGFSYPIIDGSKCINCGLCKKVCSYKYKNINNNPIITYAGATLNNDIIKKSSSGGIFGTIAYNFLKNGGIVYGCSLENENSCLSPQHIRVDNISDLYKLLGSKYVQSQMGSIYLEIKNDLLNNKKVLFSGTPCQVHSLQSFLEETRVKTDNLFSVDLICHGTPSTKMFQDYIIELEKRKHKRIKNIVFRDKEYSWGFLGTIVFEDNTKKNLYVTESSYYKFFLEFKINRENCYSCKYANKKRVGDITIGDYWGIDKMHPNYLKSNGGQLDIRKGISCIIVNSKNGKELLKKYGNDIILLQSDFEKVSANNRQLLYPVKVPKERNIILEEYKRNGYKGVIKTYKKMLGIKYYLYPIYHKIKELLSKR